MSGHSKWHSIKHKKGALDAKRGKLFTKFIKEITVAARTGGGDPDANARLRKAILDAKGGNMPNDTIERAIRRGTGEEEGVNYEEIRYEGYGIGGAAVMVDCLTDNKTRTVADVRYAFAKNGGNLGSEGSVAFLFQHCGQLVFAPGTSELAVDTIVLHPREVENEFVITRAHIQQVDNGFAFVRRAQYRQTISRLYAASAETHLAGGAAGGAGLEAE